MNEEINQQEILNEKIIIKLLNHTNTLLMFFFCLIYPLISFYFIGFKETGLYLLCTIAWNLWMIRIKM